MIRKLCTVPSAIAKKQTALTKTSLRFASTNTNNPFYREHLETRDLDKSIRVSFGSSSNDVSDTPTSDVNAKFHLKNALDDWSAALFFVGLFGFYYVYNIWSGSRLRAEAMEEYNQELAAKGEILDKQGPKDGTKQMTKWGLKPKTE